MSADARAGAGPEIEGFASRRILERLEALTREIPGVRESGGTGDDPEPLHRMRVASRRLRAALRLLGDRCGAEEPRQARRALRRITRRLGEARDLDVRIAFVEGFLASCGGRERGGAERLLLRLRQSRVALRPGVERLLDGIERLGLLDPLAESMRAAALRRRPEPDGLIRAASAPLLLGALAPLSSWAPYLERPERVEEHHEMRIAAKKLRYALELFRGPFGGGLDPFLEAARGLQAALGALHDADVWLADLPRFREEERERTVRYFGSPKGYGGILPGLRAIERDRRLFREVAFARLQEEFRSGGGLKRFEPLRALLGFEGDAS